MQTTTPTKFLFRLYLQDKFIKTATIEAENESDAMKKADRLLRDNPSKYDDWEINY